MKWKGGKPERGLLRRNFLSPFLPTNSGVQRVRLSQ